MKTPLERLQARWLKKTGEPMPATITSLSIGRVLIAVERTEAGETVFVPGVPMTKSQGGSESMREWDCDSAG